MNAIGLQVPAEDREFFATALCDAQRDLVHRWQVAMGIIAAAPTVAAGVQEAAARLGDVDGFSPANIARKYYAFMGSRDWRVFVNKARLARADRNELDKDFLDHWKKKCGENQRGSKQAYNDLLSEIRSGASMPGLGTWMNAWRVKHPGTPPPPSCPAHFTPRGCTYSNLMRYAPTKFELKAMRIGRSAAADLRPLVFTTRVGLKVGQYRIFDDVEHDHKVNYFQKNRRAMRPLELTCLDLASASKEAWGMRPTIEGDDGHKQKLKQKEMLWLLAHLLINQGYRADGTVLAAEHGTAAIPEQLEKQLYDWTDGIIRVARSGIEGEPVLKGCFVGRSKGNFRFKAALESQHNLTHNMMAALPGQMGRNREVAPEELHGRDAYNASLVKVIAKLPAERAALLWFPHLEFNEFLQIALEIYERMDWRTDHDLEGWIAAGHIQHLYVPAEGYEPIRIEEVMSLPQEKRLPVLQLIEANPTRFSAMRKLAPREVYLRGSKDLIWLPAWYTPLIFGKDNATAEITIPHNHLIEIDSDDLGPDTLRYTGLLNRVDAGQQMLKPGEKYLAFVNPFDTSRLYLCSADMKVLGWCPQWTTVKRLDEDAIHAQQGAAAHFEKLLRIPLEERHADQAARISVMKQHNELVLSGAPVTATEKARARALNKFTPVDLSEPSTEEALPAPAPSFSAENLL